MSPQHAVVIVGSGPTGMMLAGELALAGVDVAVVERRATLALESARARGMHARTIELLDQRGIAERFLETGETMQVARFADVTLDIGDFPTRHNYGLALGQDHIERLLAGWVAELPVRIYREREVTGFTQDDRGVDLTLANGSPLRAAYLVGCDGGRSLIRKAAGIEFVGSDPSQSHVMAEVSTTEVPPWGFRHDATGTHAIGPLDGGRARVVLTERVIGQTAAPTLDDLRCELRAVYGTDFGVHSPTWISRFTDMARQAASYRDRRVLLAGDAAHVHHPAGGQGLNIGMQDAVNLGWKLAQVVHETSPASLLDTYQAERHPVAAQVLRNTLAHIALHRPDDRSKALAQLVGELIRLEQPRTHLAGMMSGLDIRYDLGDGHPLIGRRMPDLDLVTDDGPVRVFTLLHQARPVLLDLGAPRGFDLAPWAARVPYVRATYRGAWELPVIGPVSAPNAVLIRPDGYVAWTGELDDPTLVTALTTWFGASRG